MLKSQADSVLGDMMSWSHIIGGLLETPAWLVLAFCLNILVGGGDLWIIVLLENEYSLSGMDNHKWWEHSNPTS